MPQITPREQRLILSFAGAVFLVLNVFGFRALSKAQKEASRQLLKSKQEQQEAGAWLQQKDYWTQRKGWLDAKQPKSAAPGQESSVLLELLQQSARQQNIVIAQQRLADPRSTPFLREAAVQLEVRGSFDAMVGWLAGLQQPDKFVAVKNLTLKCDAEPPNVIGTLTVARWYAPNP